MKKIVIINGPNLNLLGTREPEVYGNKSFDDLLSEIRNEFENIDLQYFQSNIEGELVTAIQEYGLKGFDIIINPAAYTHTSIAIGDALAAVQVKAVEVHISNIFAREEFRKHSYISSKVDGVISGLGLNGYKLAIRYLLS